MPKGVHNNHVGGNYQGTLEERFWKNVKKGDDCWLWTGTPVSYTHLRAHET